MESAVEMFLCIIVNVHHSEYESILVSYRLGLPTPSLFLNDYRKIIIKLFLDPDFLI